MENSILAFSQYGLHNHFYLQCLITLLHFSKQHEVICLWRENTGLYWLFFIGPRDLLQIYSPNKEVHSTSFMFELSLVSDCYWNTDYKKQNKAISTCVYKSPHILTICVHMHINISISQKKELYHPLIWDDCIFYCFRKTGQLSSKTRNLGSYIQHRHLLAVTLLNSGVTVLTIGN